MKEEQKQPEKPIDAVTVTNLGMALRMCDIEINPAILDKVIDVVELIEDKGDQVTIEDICILQRNWRLTAELNSDSHDR